MTPEPTGAAVEAALRDFWQKEIAEGYEAQSTCDQARDEMTSALRAAYAIDFAAVVAERDELLAWRARTLEALANRGDHRKAVARPAPERPEST